MRRLLYPFSLAYYAGLKLDKALKQPQLLPKPVFSVGNLTWGGTGKTPVVIRLCRDLSAMAVKPVVLSRGYGRKAASVGAVIVSDGSRLLSNSIEAGDEPCLIAASAPQAAVVVGNDRFAAAQAALAKLQPGAFILDDGFQHWKLGRDLDIVCVNCLDPWGNGLLIPAGTLREPLSALKRADVVILTNADRAGSESRDMLRRSIGKYFSGPVLSAGYRVTGMRRIADNARELIPTGSMLTAFSAIAQPQGFESLLAKQGYTLTAHRAFRDHHAYTRADIETLLAGSSGLFVTTAKDAVKLAGIIVQLPSRDAARFYALDIELDFIEGEQQWHDALQRTLRSSSTVTAR